MAFLFTKSADAIKKAMEARTFGVYYSETQEQDLNIHIHDCCEILLCLSGGNSFLIDGKVYDVQEGDVFVINQFEAHKITPDPDNIFARFVLQIHPDYLLANSTKNTDLSHCFYAQSGNKITLTDEEIAKFEQLVMLFRKDNGFGDDVIKNIAVNQILVLINQRFLDQSDTFSPPTLVDKTVMSTLSYIHSHFAEELTLEVLAKNTFVSVNQLCKLFKNAFGTTIAKYIVAKRIAEAKKLLLSGKNVADTATACGFPDYANFIRVFKKFVGVSPGKYPK